MVGDVPEGPGQPLPALGVVLFEDIVLAPNHDGVEGHRIDCIFIFVFGELSLDGFHEFRVFLP